MIALLQRVSEAEVRVAGIRVAAIDRGLLVLIGVERDDTQVQAERMLERILTYRVFPDAAGKMNLDLVSIDGGLLLVPQFTLAADTSKGTRPSFTPAADPAAARKWFEYLVALARSRHAVVGSGVFGADMEVALVNDGPVTFWLTAR